MLTQVWENRKNRSVAYWKKREDDYFTSVMSSTELSDQRLNTYIRQTKNSIQTRLDAFYGKYAKELGITKAEAKRRVSRFDVENFATEVGRLLQDKNLTDKARAELKLYNLTMKTSRLELLQMQVDLEAVRLYSNLELDVEGTLFREAIEEYRRQSGIMGMSVGNSEKFIHNVVHADFHGASWSEVIWGPNHAKGLRKELGRLITTVTVQGRNPTVLAKQLAEKMGTSRHNALRLLNTEAQRVNTEIKKDSYTQIGVKKYDYYAEPTACEICKDLDGQRFLVADMQPGLNAKPMHPFCMCGTLPVSDRDEWLQEVEERMKNR